MAGGKPGFVLSLRPRRYRTTEQQETMREAAKVCNITKGITRRELVDKMVNCIPEFYRKRREGKE